MSNFSSLKNMWENLAKQGKQNNVPPIKVLPSKNKTQVPINSQLTQNGSQNDPINIPVVETQISKESITALKNNLQGKINIGAPNLPKSQNVTTFLKSQSRSSDQTGSQNISTKVQVSVDQKAQVIEKMPNFQQLRAGAQRMFEKKLSGTSIQQQSKNIEKNEEGNKNPPQQNKEPVIQRIFSESNTSSTVATNAYQEQKQLVNNNENESNNFHEQSLSLRRKKTKKTVVQDFDDV